jgi:hypothetical protein
MRYFMVDVALPSSTEEEGQEEDLNNNRVPLSYILYPTTANSKK